MTTRAEVAQMLRELTWAASLAHANADRALGTTGQSIARWQVLDLFADEPRTVPSAARRLRQSRQGVQRTVDLLTDDDLLSRQANPDHQRSPLFHVTERGAVVLEEMETAVAGWQDYLAHRLDSEDIATLTRLMQVVRAMAEGYQEVSGAPS